ncbi:MAG: hypothetical protein KGL39_41280, partial [Patescibacteria group bacterium]|nr:hypothetical protein [Patescibacteria group bacterium]
MQVADAQTAAMRRAFEQLEAVAKVAQEQISRVKMTAAQASESRVSSEAIIAGVRGISEASRNAAAEMDRVKLSQAQALATRLAADEQVNALQKVERQAIKTRTAVGGSQGFGLSVAGIRSGAIIGGVGLALPALPELAAGALGLGAAGAGGIGALAGGYAALKLALAGVSAQAFTNQKAFDALSRSQQGLVQELRSLDAGLKAHLESVAQQSVIPGLQQGLSSAMSGSTVSAITGDVRAFAQAVGEAAKEWGQFIGGPFGSELGALLQRDSGYFVDLNREVMAGADIVVRFLNAAAPVTTWLDRVAANAASSADAWARSTHGIEEMKDVARLAGQALSDLGGLLGGLFHVLEAIAGATGSVNTIHLLTLAINEVAAIVNQNRGMLRDLFAGVDTSVHDALSVIRALEGPLRVVLGQIDDVARHIGGWRVVLDAIAAVWAVKFLANTAAVRILSTSLKMLGPAAVSGAASADAAVASIGTTAAETTGIVDTLLASLSALAAPAAAALAIGDVLYHAYTAPQPKVVGPGPSGVGTKLVVSNGRYYIQAGPHLTPYTGPLPHNQYSHAGVAVSTLKGAAFAHGGGGGFATQTLPGGGTTGGDVPGSPGYHSSASYAVHSAAYYQWYYSKGPGAVHMTTPAFAAPGAFATTGGTTRHPALPTGLKLLSPALAAALTHAQTMALTAAGGGTGSASNPFARPANLIRDNRQAIADANKALAILKQQESTGKNLVAIAREEKSLTQGIETARKQI